MGFIQFLFFSVMLKFSVASVGDRSPFYKDCLISCQLRTCADNRIDFMEQYKQPIYLKLLAWSCPDECKYNCMWKTVDSFHEQNWNTPQFYGKWPFIRFFGIQEPASVAFSLLNLYIHLKMARKFSQQVKSDSPLYWLWSLYSLICVHAWMWSSVFHARDFPLSESFDYVCAFSIVLANCYVMLVRILRYILPHFLLIVMTVFLLLFFRNHATYLSMGKFDYAYNMKLNILLGTFTAACWFIWSVIRRYKQPYVWKCAIFVALTGLVLLLEVLDRPPIFYIFDFHSLWHLATAPLTILQYSFAIDDCKFLRKIEKEDLEEKNLVKTGKKAK